MRSLQWRALALGILVSLFIGIFPGVSRAKKEIKILMFLWQGETGAEKGFKDALAAELADQNINYTILDSYRDHNRLKELIDGTDETLYDLIYTYGSTITARAIKSYKKTPIVFNKVLDPVTYKIVESWDIKQPNLTGVSISIPASLQVEKIQEVFGIGDIGFICNPLDRNSIELKREMEAILEQKQAELVPFEFNQNFPALSTYGDKVKNRVTCIYIPSEQQVVGYIQRIFSELNRRNIPTCVTSTSILEQGGTLCIATDDQKVGIMAGKLAAKILKGAKPAELPILQPSASEIRLYANSTILKKMKRELPKALNIQYIK